MQQQHPIVIIGGGGHTSVLIGMAKRAGLVLRGVLTRDASLLGSEIHGVPVLGLEEEYPLDAAQVAIINGVGNRASRAGSGLAVRAAVYARYHERGFFVAPLVSADAVTMPDITLGAAVQIMPGAVVQSGAMIGENSIINTRASVDHDVVIYPHAHIAPGAILCGAAVIGEQAHVGAGAIVLQGVRVGNHAVIGAGAVVSRDVPDGGIVRAAPSELGKLA
ncbi:MAG: hypothetical protein DI582_03720 [Azospirillum brasilense]|nr:MAG: hypothetical protein DI582_03720 [Azospirillum brasilense]